MSNETQHKAVYLLFCKFTLHVSGFNHTHHQEHIKLQMQPWPRWREIVAVPEAVVTVLCTSDDGCGWHPKHLEWTCRIINRLLCVSSLCKLIQISDARNHKHKDLFIWNILLFTHSSIFIVFLMSTLASYVMKPHYPRLQVLVFL